MGRHYAYLAPDRIYPAPVVTDERQAWWGGTDNRPRCSCCGKVAFHSIETAMEAARRATAQGTPMHAYQGTCGNFHTSRDRYARCD